MKRSIVLLMHVGFWIAYLIFLLLLLGIYFKGEAPDGRMAYYFEIMIGFAFTPSFLSFYAFYFFLFPKYLQYKRIGVSILLGLLIAILAGCLGGYMLYLTREEIEGPYTLACFFPALPIMSFIALIFGIIALVIKGFLTWFEELKLKESLKQKNYEMEMALVKSQLDPHFLFNTINNIDVLILKDATEASNYLNKLSDIMRFMLYETKTAEILLVKELEYIEKYIELQKIRTANTNYVHYEVIGNPIGKTIAPMVFIPFIENAFKHTTNKKLADAITIRIIIEEGYTKLICENKYDPNRKIKQGSNGLGNELIQKRLNLIYRNQHALLIKRENDLYKVILTIFIQ